MYIAYEYLLIAGILGFYLQDAAMLVFHDEFVMEKPGRHWLARVGGHLQVAKRELYMPKLWAPWALVLRGQWRDAATTPSGVMQTWPKFTSAMRPVQALSTLQAVLLLAVIPLLLVFKRNPIWMLTVLSAVYVTSALVLAYLLKYKQVLGLSRKQALTLGIEGLFCPPFAINSARRITRQLSLPNPALGFAAALTDAATRAAMLHDIEDRLATETLFAEDDHSQLEHLHRARDRARALLDTP